MNVTLIATTTIVDPRWHGDNLYSFAQRSDVNTTDADNLVEFSGRACYKSYHKPNPATRENADYMAHILSSGHFSVLEHASASFHVEGVSRALLLELERHRFLSFSVESQRYVDTAKSHPEPVIPPAIREAVDGEMREMVQEHYYSSVSAYEVLVDKLMAKGYDRKSAREAARSVLPNATPVDFIVTGNLRAWRDMLSKRFHLGADREIREFASIILDHLRNIAPNSVSDIPETPYSY